MKGDFSRASFEHHKGYSGVLMQQGRVQLDADWNEQVTITRHAVEARTRDLLGPLGAPAGSAGFAISIPAAAASTLTESCELCIDAGRLYVAGLLCENPSPQAAVLPFMAPNGAHGGGALALAYLDVWEHHVTALEDQRLSEPALGGPDTTIRTQTVWRVALLPVAPPTGGQPPQAAGALPDWRPAWQALLDQKARRPTLSATLRAWQPANQLYRVEVHEVGEGWASVKWSRENGAVAFPVVAVEILEGGAPRPGDAGDLRVGNGRGPSPASEAQTSPTLTAVTSVAATALIEVQVLQLDRDPNAIVVGDTVEVEDATTSQGDRPGVLAVVTEVRLLPDEGEQLGRMVAHLTLRASAEHAATLAQRVASRKGAALREALHPLLRRWDRSTDSPRPAPNLEPSLSAIHLGEECTLDPGVVVRFGAPEELRPGDYWQFTARADQAEQRWEPRPPDGPVHYVAPLALLEQGPSSWRVLGDLRPQFESAPALSVALADAQQRLDGSETRVGQIDATVAQLQATVALLSNELASLRERVEEVRGRVERAYIADEAIELGAVVAAHSGSAERVELSGEHNAGLVIGVVGMIHDRPDVGSPLYHVVTYGRVRCWVEGEVRPGDLLVASDVPGHARRAGLYVRPGTLLGKALTGASAADDGGSMHVDAMVMLG